MKKLSTYIREGATLRPQAFDDYVTWIDHQGEQQACTCVVGCAYEAITGHLPATVEHDKRGKIMNVIRAATGIRNPLIPFPDSQCDGHIFDVMVYCNDTLRWPRRKTADYLEQYGH